MLDFWFSWSFARSFVSCTQTQLQGAHEYHRLVKSRKMLLCADLSWPLVLTIITLPLPKWFLTLEMKYRCPIYGWEFCHSLYFTSFRFLHTAISSPKKQLWRDLKFAIIYGKRDAHLEDNSVLYTFNNGSSYPSISSWSDL